MNVRNSLRIATLCCALLAVAAHAQNTGSPNTGSIAGQALAPDGKPLAGATVSLFRSNMGQVAGPQTPPVPVTATSDADGQFSFTDLAPRPYFYRIERTGYLPSNLAMRRGSSALQSGSVSINLTPDQHLNNYVISLVPEATLSGVITGADGAPVAGAQLIVFRQVFNGNLATAGATTDDRGLFHFTSLLPGRYSILSSLPAVSGYQSGYSPGTFDVTECQQRTGADIQLRKAPAFHIRGKVQNHLDPDAHFQILASVANNDPYDRSSPIVAPVKPDGSFELSGISAGSWSLATMSVRGLAKMVGVATVKVQDHDVADVVAAANPPLEIKGTVHVTPDGAALPPMAQVFLQPIGIRAVQGVRAMVAPDGSFTLANVPPGHYTLNLGIPQPGYLKSVTLGDREMQPSDIDTSAATGPLQLTVSMAAAEIDGTVVGADGKPTGTDSVTIAPDPDQPDRTTLYRSVRAGDNGKFIIPALPPGKYRLFGASTLETSFNVSPESLKPFDGSATRVTVEEGGKVDVSVKELVLPTY